MVRWVVGSIPHGETSELFLVPERDVFNDALHTFYLWLYGIGHG